MTRLFLDETNTKKSNADTLCRPPRAGPVKISSASLTEQCCVRGCQMLPVLAYLVWWVEGMGVCEAWPHTPGTKTQLSRLKYAFGNPLFFDFESFFQVSFSTDRPTPPLAQAAIWSLPRCHGRANPGCIRHRWSSQGTLRCVLQLARSAHLRARDRLRQD